MADAGEILRLIYMSCGESVLDWRRRPAQQAFAGEQDQRAPDQREADQAVGRKRFLEQPHAEQELQGRRQVLQQPQDRQRDAARAAGEQQQRDRGERTGHHQQHAGGVGVGIDEHVLAVHGQPDDVGGCQREQHDGLERQALERAERRRLAQQAVAAEGEGQEQGDPGHRAGLPGQPGHAQRGDRDRHPLNGAQALLQDQVAQHDIDQRIDEIAEAGFDHVVVGDRPDIDQPVGAEQHGRQHEAEEYPRLEHHVQPFPLAPQHQHDEQETERPQHAVRQDLHGGHVTQRVEINGEQAPAEEGQGRVNDAGTHGNEGWIAGMTLSLNTYTAAGACLFWHGCMMHHEIFLLFFSHYFMVRRTNTKAMV